jgi:hypothetical protein
LNNREVLIATTARPGDGIDYAHPDKPSYSNPITAVFAIEGNARMKFETRDRAVGKHNGSDALLTRNGITPPDSIISEI